MLWCVGNCWHCQHASCASPSPLGCQQTPPLTPRLPTDTTVHARPPASAGAARSLKSHRSLVPAGAHAHVREQQPCQPKQHVNVAARQQAAAADAGGSCARVVVAGRCPQPAGVAASCPAPATDRHQQAGHCGVGTASAACLQTRGRQQLGRCLCPQENTWPEDGQAVRSMLCSMRPPHASLHPLCGSTACSVRTWRAGHYGVEGIEPVQGLRTASERVMPAAEVVSGIAGMVGRVSATSTYVRGCRHGGQGERHLDGRQGPPARHACREGFM
jgi:hypothetical protein